jgi:hypothetical protein
MILFDLQAISIARLAQKRPCSLTPEQGRQEINFDWT